MVTRYRSAGRRRAARCAATILLALAILSAPAKAEEASEAATVFAAASTASALTDLAARYEAAGGGRVRLVFAASSTLAKQIAQGAPADLFLSANPAWMDHLAKRGAIAADSRVDLLGNRLVLIVPRAGENEPAADRWDDLAPLELAVSLAADGGRPVAVADPGHVPAGLYAMAALESFGLWQGLAGRTVRTADVRAALVLVDRGEAASGIVYATDAAISERVRVVGRFPAESHPPIVYPLALVAGRPSAAGRRFYEHLRSPAAAEVFRAHGFLVPPEAAP